MTNEERKQRNEEDTRHVMSTEAGRRFVLRLLERSGIYRCSYRVGDAETTFFNEGGRNQGLMLLAEVETAAPGSFQLMMKEKNNE